jgi:hypothetical protein
MRGGRGRGRGGLTKKSPGPGRQKSDAPGTTTTTPKKDVDEKGTAKKPPTGPPTKQEQRQTTRTGPPTVGVTADPPVTVRVGPRMPTVGIGEVTTDEHITAVRNTGDANTLARLLGELVAGEPHRTGLIRTVRRQIIRIQLREMMGGPIATRANIELDGMPSGATPLRDVKAQRKKDTIRRDGTERQTAVWNSSLTDSEVDTIRDIKVWAGRQTRQTLADTDKVLIQLVGTSGPCEACKQRLFIMANGIVDEWSRRTGLRKDQLPEVEVQSFYGNPPKYFERMGYTDVLNGWWNDPTPPDMRFRNKKGDVQDVREHVMGSVNIKAPASNDDETRTTAEKPATSDDETRTTTEKPDMSNEEPETSDEEPERSTTTTTKSATSQDLVSTDF